MKKVLIISDGKPGHENQSIAFAKLKGLQYDIVNVKFCCKFMKIASYILDRVHVYINLQNIKIKNRDYKAVVSTGSNTYYTNKYLSKKLGIKSIAIMFPKGFRYDNFDYIVANAHDNPPKRDNIVITPLTLSTNEPKGYIKRSEKKSLAIIIGGDNSIFTMKADRIKKEIDKIFRDYPSYLKYITTSRRTPKEIEEMIEGYKFDYKLLYSKDPSINPVPDFIEICDEIFITIDSASMLSEVKANSKAKIHIIGLESKKRDTKFHKLANIVERLDSKTFSFKEYLDKIEI